LAWISGLSFFQQLIERFGIRLPAAQEGEGFLAQTPNEIETQQY
jgi:hypothetical protein